MESKSKPNWGSRLLWILAGVVLATTVQLGIGVYRDYQASNRPRYPANDFPVDWLLGLGLTEAQIKEHRAREEFQRELTLGAQRASFETWLDENEIPHTTELIDSITK